MSYIQVHDLSKQYGHGEAAVLAVRGINFGIASGELIAIMGASGSGKSTLLHLIGGLDVPEAGAVYRSRASRFKLVVFANAALRASVKAMRDVLEALRRDGTTDKVLDRMVGWDERQRLVQLPAFSALEARYAPVPTRPVK